MSLIEAPPPQREAPPLIGRLQYNMSTSQYTVCYNIQEEEERREPGGDMASSIKALALSVQNTGMFGDLPRPRVNSATRFK